MTPPSTTAQATRTGPAAARLLDRVASMLALLVPILVYIEVEATPSWYPTWLYLGDLTVPTGLLPPFVLAVVVLWRTGVSARPGGHRGKALIIDAIIAGLVALLSVYAVFTLNVAQPGVYWAGLPPMVLGVALAVVVLAREGAGRVLG